MTAVDTPIDVTAQGLSCYTANLALYLAREDAHTVDRIARSVHLAVRIDDGEELGFSHHASGLHRVGDEELSWAWSNDPREVLAGLGQQLDAHGAVLVLTDTGAMPWSLTPANGGAPHLVLVDGHEDGRWHVVDRFAAIVPEGSQEPFEGWVDEVTLLAATTPRADAPPEHDRRTTHAFGLPLTAPPAGAHGWLHRHPATGPAQEWSGDGWIAGPEQVLPFLTEFFSALDERPDRVRYLDDIWAASQHHVFRHTHLVDPRVDAATRTAAVEVWQSVPAALRFAADSAARGRFRRSVVSTTFAAVLDAERAVTTLTEET